MEIKTIKELIKIFNLSGLNKLEIKDGDFTINLQSKDNKDSVILDDIIIPKSSSSTEIKDKTDLKSEENCIDFNNVKKIISPMVGMFYLSKNAEAEPFVEIGDKVKKGDCLCLIEAMKVLSEITSDYDGEIVDICVGDGQLVEYGQVLFKIV